MTATDDYYCRCGHPERMHTAATTACYGPDCRCDKFQRADYIPGDHNTNHPERHWPYILAGLITLAVPMACRVIYGPGWGTITLIPLLATWITGMTLRNGRDRANM